MEATVSLAPPAREQIHRLCALLGRAERAVRRALAAPLLAAELTIDEFCLLAACDAPELPGQTDLTAMAALSAAQTSTLLDRLRQRGLLIPERDSADRRRQVWSLTPAGRARLSAAWKSLEPVLDDLRLRLTPVAWESLGRALAQLATPLAAKRRCA